MRHAVHILMYNQNEAQLELSKKTLASVLAQDIPVSVFIINNGSDEATRKWLDEEVKSTLHGFICHYDENICPLIAVNRALADTAWWNGHDHVLCLPNDISIPTNLYREFLNSSRGVVTASMTTDPNFPYFEESKAISENTPMCVVMWRRWVVDAVVSKYGYLFDESLWNYCSDCDLALRLCALGIRGVQLDLQYWHFGSASHRLVDPSIGNAMRAQADVSRSLFHKKWGFGVGDCQYVNSALDLNFKG